MTYIVTRLCFQDEACIDDFPVECMVLGHTEEKRPWLHIDGDT